MDEWMDALIEGMDGLNDGWIKFGMADRLMMLDDLSN